MHSIFRFEKWLFFLILFTINASAKNMHCGDANKGFFFKIANFDQFIIERMGYMDWYRDGKIQGSKEFLMPSGKYLTSGFKFSIGTSGIQASSSSVKVLGPVFMLKDEDKIKFLWAVVDNSGNRNLILSSGMDPSDALNNGDKLACIEGKPEAAPASEKATPPKKEKVKQKRSYLEDPSQQEISNPAV